MNYPISSMQPYYFVAESFQEAKKKIQENCATIQKPFNVSFDAKTSSVTVDRKIKTRMEKNQTGPMFWPDSMILL